MDKKLFFALDIGTRSVVGLVGQQTEGDIELLCWERMEHHTRAMMDGQIHDVTAVAKVISTIKAKLEEKCGPLKKVSVAAAGRALCTIKAKAELDTSTHGALTANDEYSLEVTAIQAAQQRLATSKDVADPASYYCVGYSVIGYTLDSTSIKSLIGQRGKMATIELIATFLPRQVIDSMQSAIDAAGLEIATLTLEPIAAINVLIPQTMRHLNLALVDVGAGTSDVAITSGGSVNGYGMVPCAGDEITEAISQKYLLDFYVAEVVKRKLISENKKITFTDVLGATNKVTASTIISAIAPNVNELAQAIAAQIITLNTAPPQAVLLVGGGSMTPLLPESLAKALSIDPPRVAIRRPEKPEGLLNIPNELSAPDAVTPLGILKISASRTLNFMHVTLNGQLLRLFNLGQLSVADAMLAAGINVRSLHGRPGLALTISVNGQTQFIPGTLGHPGHIEINGQPGELNTLLSENDQVSVTKGTDGITPSPQLKEVTDIPSSYSVEINEQYYTISPRITVNGTDAAPETKLSDNDEIICTLPHTLEEVLSLTDFSTKTESFTYTLNAAEYDYDISQQYTINGIPAVLSTTVKAQDKISFLPFTLPTIGELLGFNKDPKSNKAIKITFNGKECLVPTISYILTLNGRSAGFNDIVPSGSVLSYTSTSQSQPIISEVLLAANFNPQTLLSVSHVDVLLNGKKTEYTAPVKEGDAVDVVITSNNSDMHITLGKNKK
jgi:cell division protein FtsA